MNAPLSLMSFPQESPLLHAPVPPACCPPPQLVLDPHALPGQQALGAGEARFQQPVAVELCLRQPPTKHSHFKEII